MEEKNFVSSNLIDILELNEFMILICEKNCTNQIFDVLN